ncbi:two-component system sensor histidine kinase YesM [Paenibacillus sp. V4I3]|uniref:sensor histidine kinase n=1 Tax=Paenibacillus sp. V4I3 TaxID=3042305 RepID=UPI002783C3C9|nr:histidine kinase [Paenibacillus sp. V4I3]MDQ0878522.1 two-component system sensor histidine kinase YesM [Paenibacillus sp. V4I3]
MRNSLRFKFVAGFLIIIIPLIFFLLFNNLYAITVVREQVSTTNSNLLAQHVKQINKMFAETNTYLYDLWDNEIDINQLNDLTFGTDEYLLTKKRIVNRFQTNLNYFFLLDTIFLFNDQTQDVTFVTKQDYYFQQKLIVETVPKEMADQKNVDSPVWRLIQFENRTVLMKTTRLTNNLIAGAIVNTDSLVASLEFLDMGTTGGAVILTKNGAVASHTTLGASELKGAVEAVPHLNNTYQIVTDPKDNNKYLLISVFSEIANINYTVMIPEGTMLKHLPFFQIAVYFIPLCGILILLFYLYFLRSVLLKPMNSLMRGMNRIMRGDLNIRLNENHSSEFSFLIGTFNNMVTEISKLKIDVYEEKIRTQEAEFGLLQVQIRPHFYLNSLNIIYSLAAIKEYALIQKMTQHLAEYFRFITQTKQGTVTLEAEIRHTQNYLEIQKLRFPNQLIYEIELPDRYRKCDILPLTIQTFVENSIIHGFTDRRELFTVRIIITADEQDFLWIEVSDSGVGFSETFLKKLKEDRYEDELFAEGHLGIQNVIKRQRIRYKGKAQLLFSNGKVRGAEVKLGIPMSYCVNEEDEDV